VVYFAHAHGDTERTPKTVTADSAVERRQLNVCFLRKSAQRNDPKRTLAPSWHSTLKEVAKCSQWLKTVANDFGNRQHGHRENHARNTPHPEPEHERDDDEDGI
jgi:hypothetical protein